MKKKYWLFLLCFFVLRAHSFGQSAQDIIRAVTKAQQATQRVSYNLVRSDTLVTSATRTLTGRVIMQAMRQDTLFGFSFWAKQDDLAQELVYDGRQAYEVDATAHIYSRLTRPAQLQHLASQAGGRLLVPDLMALDTTKARSFLLTQDTHYYYLTMRYPDLPAYDVVHRCKVLTIARQSLLPVAVKRHQVTLGKPQTLIYEVKDLKVNDQAQAFNFSKPAFIDQYKQQLSSVATAPVAARTSHQPAPPFQLTSLDNQLVSLADLRGKVVLLDFWEAWCGPCMEAMPKVQQLQARYAAQGLYVCGITHEHKQLDVLKKVVASRGIAFPTLLGTAQSKQSYRLAAVPLYVLIDRQGLICFQHEGFSPELETTIQQALSR